MTFQESEDIRAVHIGVEGQIGVIVGDKGSIFSTTDGGQTWEEATGVTLQEPEFVQYLRFSQDARSGVMVSNEGSTFVTRNAGKNWELTNGFGLGWAISVLETVNSDLLSMNTRGTVYLLKAAPELADLLDEPLSKIPLELESASEFARQAVGDDIIELVDQTNLAPSDAGENAAGEAPDDGIWRLVSDQMIYRVVTVVVMFFMVQVLIRLYQYNMRLAAFWESGAVAVELSYTFGSLRPLPFDHLVQALSPDSVDFRAMPKPTYEAIADRIRTR